MFQGQGKVLRTNPNSNNTKRRILLKMNHEKSNSLWSFFFCFKLSYWLFIMNEIPKP